MLQRALRLLTCFLAAGVFAVPLGAQEDQNLVGLPPLSVPGNNPITREKVQLGDRLYNDLHFSGNGKVACATCHLANKGFTDHLDKAKGINDLRGTRNSPTVINAAFNFSNFWDGRSGTLEDQAQHPFTNPVEMGLPDHEAILKYVRQDENYKAAFKDAFGVNADQIELKHVLMAIASFERTIIGGNSRFDHWYYLHEKTLSPSEERGFQVFVGNGRCLSCHQVEQTSALFMDGKFHNIGVGINRIPAEDVTRLANEFLKARYDNSVVDKKVLTDGKTSELGRFAVTREIPDMGAFKTPTLRNIALTAPYMHDGSLKTLEEVVEHYNRGGASSPKDTINPYLSGGIRPLNLTAVEKKDLVAFMKALTTPKFAGGQKPAKKSETK